MNRRVLLLAASATALSRPAIAARRERPGGYRLAADLDAAIDKAMALGVAPGLAVAVYSREGVYTRAFGVTDIATGERTTIDTAFYVASTTKSLTSLALAALHHRGELDLDSTLAAYAPGAPFPAGVRPAEVRLRDLLSHRGGIENDPISYRLAFTGQHDPETLWRLLAASQPNPKAPLGRFQYTNVGYNIATILTDRRLGVRWQDLLQREIFGPTRMTHTTALMSQAQAAGWSIAKPHGLGASGRMERIYLEKTDQTMQSAGGVVMSVRDAALFLELLIEDGRLERRRIIPATTMQAVRAPLAVVGDTWSEYRRGYYGLGWYLATYRGERMLHDFGGFPGFRSHLSYLPDRNIGVAAFINDTTAADPLVDAIANYVYDLTGGHGDSGARFDAALAAVSARRDALVKRNDAISRAGRPWTLTRPRSAYAGAYSSPLAGRIEIGVEGEAMRVGFGVLHAVAEPFTLPDAVRVELAPGSGTVIQFEGQGPAPNALILMGQRFERLAS